ATYSSTGIREAVKAALKKAAGQASSASSADEDETVGTGTTATELSVSSYDDSAVWADGIYTGSARGFGGIIKVQVTIKSGKITSIQVLSHSGETASYFNKAKAIISRILKAQSPNVDTVSGATYSSTGIREAVKAALKKAAGQASSASSADEDEDVEDAAEQTVSAASQEVTLPEGAPADGSYTGTGECAKFGYSVTLTAVFQNGELTALKDFALVDNDDADNEPFAASAWKGMKTNLLSGSTDVVSGATYSSNAILAAYQDAYTQAVAAGGGTVETPGESDDSDETQNSDPDEDEAQDEQDATEDTGSGSDLTGVPADGTYTASALCEPDEYEDFEAYTLTADVTFAGGKLVSIDNLTSTDDSNVKYYTRAAQGTSKYTGVVAQLIDKQSGADIDAVSNATCSSVALVALYKNAYAQAVAAGGGTVETPGESDDSDEPQNGGTGEQDEQGETEDTDNGGEEDEKDEQDKSEDTGSDLTGVPADGTYTASALCEPDEYEDFEVYTLTADVTFADGKLVSIDNLTSTDDSNVKYYTRAAQGTSKYTGVVAQLIDKQSGADIDAVSNATCSSVALVALYENAYAQAVAANTGETEAEEPESEEEAEPEEASEEEPAEEEASSEDSEAAEEEASSEDGEAAEAESTDESTEEQEAEQPESAEQETVTAAFAEEQAAEEQMAEEETEEPASGDEQETEPASEETPQQNEQEDGSE
ncbi:MAG: FMN-binding protein, partial [Clostridiales bacterium]|nr:FMN-binding protein [Clostridiales bacterium]